MVELNFDSKIDPAIEEWQYSWAGTNATKRRLEGITATAQGLPINEGEEVKVYAPINFEYYGYLSCTLRKVNGIVELDWRDSCNVFMLWEDIDYILGG